MEILYLKSEDGLYWLVILAVEGAVLILNAVSIEYELAVGVIIFMAFRALLRISVLI